MREQMVNDTRETYRCRANTVYENIIGEMIVVNPGRINDRIRGGLDQNQNRAVKVTDVVERRDIPIPLYIYTSFSLYNRPIYRMGE